MLHVATVITNREALALRERHAEDIRQALSSLGGNVLEQTWLGEAEAFDMVFEGTSLDASEVIETADLRNVPLDCIIQPLAGREKTLFVADMDSTIIAEECIDEIAAVLNLKDKIAPITEAAMQGKIDFKDALRKRVALLKGVTRDQLQDVLDSRVSINPGAEIMIRTMNNAGIKTALVSGGFHFFADTIARTLGFHHVKANTLIFEDERLTGDVQKPIIDGDTKQAFLIKLANGNPKNALALGDGANDIPMFEAAGLSLSYRGKPKAEKAAGGCLRHAPLKGVLYCLGLREITFQQ